MAKLNLFNLEIYKQSHLLGTKCWQIVCRWSIFDRDTIGKQLTRSADSVSLNFCEGYGRYYYNDRKRFCFYSRGSLYETLECLIKAHERNLIHDHEFYTMEKEIEDLGMKLNNFIGKLKDNAQKS